MRTDGRQKSGSVSIVVREWWSSERREGSMVMEREREGVRGSERGGGAEG